MHQHQMVVKLAAIKKIQLVEKKLTTTAAADDN